MPPIRSLLLLVSVCCYTASAQTLAPPFAGDYSIVDLGAPLGVPANLGGITFLDANTLLIGGSANGGSGSVYTIGVTRDAVTGSITAFAGTSTLYAATPQIDGGLAFGPGGVLFFTGYPTNTLGQLKPGSNSPDKTIDLNTASVASSVGALQFVPAGFPGAGQLKVASYNASTWYTLGLTPDGSGTYDVTSTSPSLAIGGGPEGIAYIDDFNPQFGVQSVLISEYGAGRVSAYDIDANGDPIVATRRDFLTGLSGAEGATLDPLTGDFLFSTFGGGNRLIVVTGFIPEPASATFAAMAVAMASGVRRRQRVQALDAGRSCTSL
jgi:hypothetical protein